MNCILLLKSHEIINQVVEQLQRYMQRTQGEVRLRLPIQNLQGCL